MSIGHHPQQPQHTPDMRKPEAEVSESDRAEATRRIQGSQELGGLTPTTTQTTPSAAASGSASVTASSVSANPLTAETSE